MKSKYLYKLVITGILTVVILSSATAQQSLSGTYTMTAEQATLTLVLTQTGNMITGTLSSNSGASFQLEGEVMEGAGAGICTGGGSSVFFEVFLAGSDLTLGLIDPDEFNMPDYDQAQYLLFTKQSEQAGTKGQTGNITGKLFGNNQQTNQQPDNQQYNNQQNYNQQNLNQQNYNQGQEGWSQQGNTGQEAGSSTIGINEVGDPSWGFKFVPPAGWVHQKSAEAAILGHTTIAGMILVLPHMAENMQQMQQELYQGIQEEGNYLTLSGGLNQVSQNVISGDYTGIMDGTQVKAKGMGILSPFGGGAYLIAVSTPDKLGNELITVTENIARNMQFFKVEVAGLIQHFAGNWASFTTSTSTWMCFCSDGSYSEQYEAAYSGNFDDGSGNWSAANQDSGQGRWTVRGTKEAGQIIVRMNNSQEIIYEYKVHQEKGYTYYNEYWFNGRHYSKKTE
ncbi:MAG: hypothetical protein AMS27_05600 [Bacteroides sp. SM23_62_1]|nr:MAG: hypothetical protein AMS27_05600 [Bacteroides sp. SM23_62_1]